MLESIQNLMHFVTIDNYIIDISNTLVDTI